MLKKCEYCDSYYDDTLPECPNCGAINKNVRRTNNETLHTIEELQAFCAAKHIDQNQVRFFIGKDVREPKCFGIYKNENGDFVVYKNKSDGTRAIRYEGTDEAYAVNELFMRLENEFINQHSQQYGAPFSQYGGYYDQLHNNQQGGYNQNTNYTQNSNTYVPQGWHNVNEQNSHWNYRTGTNNYYNQGNWNGGAGDPGGRGPGRHHRKNPFWKFLIILYILTIILGGISALTDHYSGSSSSTSDSNYHSTYEYNDSTYDDNSYDSYDSYDSDSSWDSDWGSDSDWDSSDWDSDSTDWDSDW